MEEENKYDDIAILEDIINDASQDVKLDEIQIDWLKDLRDRVKLETDAKWKPSEEQMNALNQSLSEYGIDGDVYRNLCSLYDDLKKLM